MSEPADRPQPAETRKQAILVLGMHRSGTSALTGLLEMFGATTPQGQIPASEQNARGFFEATRVARLNDKLLTLDDLTWDSWQPVPEKGQGIGMPDDYIQQAGEILRDEFGDAPLIALKDPRICRLVPFWAAALRAQGRAPFFLLAVRNPMEVAQSLLVRNEFELAHGLMLWMTYVLESEGSTRGQPRAFSTFDLLMKEPLTIVTKLSEHLSMPEGADPESKQKQIDTFLSPDLRHHESGDLSDLPPIFESIYSLMTRWGQHGEDPQDYPYLDRIRNEFEGIGAQAGDAAALFEVLEMIGQDVSNEDLAEQLGEAKNLRKPELLTAHQRLLRRNAALITAQRRAQLNPEKLAQLKLNLIETKDALGRANTIAQHRSAETAKLSQMLIELRAKAARQAQSIQQLTVQNETLRRDLDAQRTRRAADQSALRQVTRENTDLHALVAQLGTDRARMETDIGMLNDMVAEVEGWRAELEGKNEELHALVFKVESERQALVSSLSWRLSRPVRWAGKLWHRLRR